MKKLSLFIFLGLMICNVGFSKEIKISHKDKNSISLTRSIWSESEMFEIAAKHCNHCTWQGCQQIQVCYGDTYCTGSVIIRGGLVYQGHNSFDGYPSLDMLPILYGGVVVQCLIWGSVYSSRLRICRTFNIPPQVQHLK